MLRWYEPVAVGTILRNPVLRLPEFFSGIVLYGMFREGTLTSFISTTGRRILVMAFVGCSFAAGAWLIADGPMYWRYLVHNGAMLPAQLALIALCASARLPARCERLAARLGNSALSIFAIHAPLFLLMMKATKLLSMGMSPFECAAHFAACAAAAKDVVPGMGSFPLYLAITALAAVYFQERLVVPLRDFIRRKLLAHRRTQKKSHPASA
jgi:hypothetical protein